MPSAVPPGPHNPGRDPRHALPPLPEHLNPRRGARRRPPSRADHVAGVFGMARVGSRLMAAFLSFAIVAGSGLLWAKYHQIVAGLHTSGALSVLGSNAPTSAHGDTNILLIGLDSRKDMNGKDLPPAVVANELHAGDSSGVGGYNTNTLILLHVPGDGSKATAISIPRDDYVSVPGYGMRKIKEAYGLAKSDADSRLYAQGVQEPAREQQARDAGRRSTLITVQNLLQVPIDHFAEVNLIGFYDIVKALGPVKVCLNAPVQDVAYSGANFPAGVQELNPSQALSFVRQRHGLVNGDLDRTHRQQAFIAAVTNKLKTNGVFGNLAKMQGLIDVTKNDIVIDDKLDPLQFALAATNLTGGKVDFYTLPIDGYGTRNGQSVNLVDPEKVRGEVQTLLTRTPPKPNPPPAPKTPVNAAHETVDVYNGTGQSGLAAKTMSTLTGLGFGKGQIGTIAQRASTAVAYGDGAQTDAAIVAKRFGTNAVADSSLPAGHIQVSLGGDGGAGSASAQPSPSVPTSGSQGSVVKGADGIPCVN